MRRVQLLLSEHLDAALSAAARRGGMSRSAAARRLLERALREREAGEIDGARLLKIAGIVDSKGRSDARDVDEVVYGVSRRAGLRRQRAAHRSR
jgi:metal-responsive CopG/Arc/MetJ family transcriptional regulator